MEILFKIKDIEFTKEDFLDDIREYDDIIPIIKDYEENLTYGQKNSEWSFWTKELRKEVKQDSIDKIRKEG